MTVTPQETLTALRRLAGNMVDGLASLDGLLVVPVQPVLSYEAPQSVKDSMAATIRSLYGAMTVAQWSAIERVLNGQPVAPVPNTSGLTVADFMWAAGALAPGDALGVAKIRAVDEVESLGGGFDDVREAILALDGPGGFLTGPKLPKLLFEAHKFDEFTGGKYRSAYPNLSSAVWNRALYVGGQGEWERLYNAMKLDRIAALKSASYGRYQIMGFNFDKAGYADVETFVDAMKTSERLQLEAFVSFIRKAGLVAAFKAISMDAHACEPFARGYNGSGQVAVYSGRIATAFKKFG